MRWLGQEGNIPNLGSTEQSTVVLIEIIKDAACHKCTEVPKWIVFLSQDLAQFFPDPATS